MKLEIDLPNDCMGCVFCEESVYCKLLCGEPIYQDDEYDVDHRAKFCPFDSKDRWAEMYEGVRILPE